MIGQLKELSMSWECGNSFSNIQIFSPDGTLLMFFGDASTNPGGFAMPAGMHIDEQDRLYVADQFNKRLQVFKYLGAPDLPQD